MKELNTILVLLCSMKAVDSFPSLNINTEKFGGLPGVLSSRMFGLVAESVLWGDGAGLRKRTNFPKQETM